MSSLSDEQFLFWTSSLHCLVMRKLIPCLLLCIACDDLPTDRIDHSPPIDRTSISKETPSQWFLGRVIHGVSRLPIKGAQVRLLGTQYETLSDADGVYVLPVRAGFEQVRVYSASFDDSTTRVGETTRLWPLNVSDEDAWRVLRRRTVTVDSDDLADPDLRPEARTLLAHLRETGHWEPSLAPRDRVLKQGLQPPATIRIYRRGAENNSCTGRVDVIPLEDYVKGVVPHEWIPSWHDESLRAGSIAARSFAWGWINAGGKYDCADLDDTTRSQVYREDRTARATAAVDSTVGMAVVRDGAVVRAEYSAENSDPTAFGVDEPLCTGRELFGHGRGMCQWGSQRWATQRDQVAEWMVEHYYPGASVGGGIAPDPQPQIELRQRIARIDAITCSDPSAMFDCADFVDQSWSEGLFDLFVGHRMTVSIEVANTGASVAYNVVLQVDLSGPQIAVEQVQATGAQRALADELAKVHHVLKVFFPN